MHRTLPNILFILILFLITTVLPLSTDILSLNLSQKIVDKPVEDIVLDPELSTSLPSEVDSITKKDISFDINSNMNLFPNDLLSGYQVLIMKNDLSVAEYELTDLSPEVVSVSEQSRTIKLDKSKLLSDLPVGHYTVVLYEDSEMLDYQWYATNLNYDKKMLMTSNTLPAKQISLTMFIPTHDFKYTVPITRHTTTTENRFRTLYNTLQNGVKAELGLNELRPLIPASPNIRVGGKVANVYLYPANLIGFEDNLPLISNAITKSFMALGGVEGVKFIINNKTSGTDFGFDLATTYTDSTINNAFIGYSHNSDYMMLLPMPLASQTVEERIQEAFKALKFESSYNYSVDMIQTIPTEISLLNHQVTGTQLTLNLSGNTNGIFEGSADYQTLMIQSLLYTFTSFPEIDTIVLTIDGEPIVTPLFDFTTPIKPDIYYNMEP